MLALSQRRVVCHSWNKICLGCRLHVGFVNWERVRRVRETARVCRGKCAVMRRMEKWNLDKWPPAVRQFRSREYNRLILPSVFCYISAFLPVGDEEANRLLRQSRSRSIDFIIERALFFLVLPSYSRFFRKTRSEIAAGLKTHTRSIARGRAWKCMFI